MAWSRHLPPPFDDGFPAFYASHSREVLLFFARRTYDPEAALDLTAETFAQALASSRHYRGQSEDDAAAWVHGIARHLLARYFRKGRVERRALERLGVDIPAAGEDELERIEELADLRSLRSSTAEALRELSRDHRRALELRVVRELPYAEVAAQLGTTEQTARARVSRGLSALAEHLDRFTARKEAT